MRFRRALLCLTAPIILSLVPAFGCTTEPRNVPCSNDGQCEKDNPQFKYCLESRCVECVGNASCEHGGSCVDGRCVISCVDDRGCPRGARCVDATCAGG